MATFYLIRHGTNDLVSHTLAGRQPDIHLNAAGRAEAARLAATLAHSGIDYIFSSPLERARETAEPLAEMLKLPIQVAEGLQEINFGEWTNRKVRRPRIRSRVEAFPGYFTAACISSSISFGVRFDHPCPLPAP